jgi:cobalt-zinc-cadmium resistance protein CzcA
MTTIVAWLARRRGLALGLSFLLLLVGAVGLLRIPIDAVPDVTNNQVQIVTSAPALSAGEVEKTVTLPVERAMAGLPGLKEVRSVSKLGVSLVTLVFHDDVDVYFARQQVGERLVLVREEIPASIGRPELGPVATGLGEIYMFELEPGSQTPEELRTLMDWRVGPKLRQVPGVIEVVAFGGAVKQYRITLDPGRLAAHHVSLDEVRAALERDNANAGGGAIEKAGEQIALRGEGRFKTLGEIAHVVVKTDENGTPLTVGMLGDVDTGAAFRQGAMTKNGRGEIVGGSVLMLRGQNSREVVARVQAEIEQLNPLLPPGVRIVPYLDRAEFIQRTVATVVKNLVEGALIVTVVLLLTLGSLRAGVLVAGAIPFSLMLAFAGLVATGMSANVMSLGAVDFGIVVEGAVVVVEHALHAAAHARRKGERRRRIVEACVHAARPVTVAVIIVLLVFLPLATLEDVEGKMFRPVVVSLVFMLAGALFYALVLVPAVAPRLLQGYTSTREPLLVRGLRALYEPVLERALRFPKITLALGVLVTAACLVPARTIGAEFLPRIFEGAFAIDARRPVSVSVTQAIALARETELALLELPEVEKVISRIGRTEGSIDPAGPESSDVFVILKPRDEWRKGLTPEALVEQMDQKLGPRVPATLHAFSQPIEMRVNDLIAGVKSDVAVKVFGEDIAVMQSVAEQLRAVLADTPGSADVKMEVPVGLPAYRVAVDRARAARLGVPPRAVLDAIEAARAGKSVGVMYEGERSFDILVRLGGEALTNEKELGRLPIATHGGQLVPLDAVATLELERGLFQVSREQLRRRLVVEANVRGRDLVGFVAEARQRAAGLKLPPGVEVRWGGQFENFTRAKNRLSLLVPVALAIIAGMLFVGYRSVRLTLVTLAALPFAVGGGVVGLVARGMPFSIPAAVGFIALAGVSVMSGVVLTTRLLETSPELPMERRLREAAHGAFRPTLSTALVAALGFIPMAIATSAGAEVQRPLATVVISGLLVGVVLSLLVMPVMLGLAIGRRGLARDDGGAEDGEDDDEPEPPGRLEQESAPAE